MKVSVSRTNGEESLNFECATDGKAVEVRHVTYDNQAGRFKTDTGLTQDDCP
jgi:hypothetical protein